MKTSLLCLAAITLACASVQAQTPTTTPISSASVSARDGFTRSGTNVLFTRNGVTETLQKEVVLPSGLRVMPDGSVTLPNGERTSLGSNQLLTTAGTIEDAALTPDGVAPVMAGGMPRKPSGDEVGISANDGVTISGTEAIVTRNGVSENLTQVLRMSDGTRVQPDGTILRPDGTQITLRPTQVLTFDGVLRDIPMNRNTNPGTPVRQSPQ